MANTEPKVQFNLHDVHYALLSADGDEVSYATPVHVPGAVSLALESQNDMKIFYADGIAFYVSQTNKGYSGDLEMAKFIDRMLTEVWGYVLDTASKVLSEYTNAKNATFALLFAIDNDVDDERYCLYACTGTRPGIASSTTGEDTDPQTQKTSITAVPLSNGLVFSRTTVNTPAEIKNNWFKSVHMDTPPAAAAEV